MKFNILLCSAFVFLSSSVLAHEIGKHHRHSPEEVEAASAAMGACVREIGAADRDALALCVKAKTDPQRPHQKSAKPKSDASARSEPPKASGSAEKEPRP